MRLATASFLFLLLLLSGNLFSQRCSDILISEIIFGYQGDNLNENSDRLNYSIELYNPTERTINLGSYSLEFFLHNSENLYRIVTLEGNIEPNSTYVISNPSAQNEILLKSDKISEDLNFSDVLNISLSNGETIIDEFGNKQGSLYSEGIDLERLLNDPEYINSILINFSLLKGLSIRRSPLVREGNDSFQNFDFLEEWNYYPSIFLEHLAIHKNACHEVFILWNGIDNMNPEVTLNESNEDIGASGEVILSDQINELVEFEIIVVPHIYTQFLDGNANFTDYSLEIDIAQTFQIPSLSTSRSLDRFILPLADGLDEIAEGVGFRMFPISGNVTLDSDRNIFDVRILDPLVSTKNIQEFSSFFSVYPTVVNDKLTINSLNNKHLISSVAIYDSNAIILKRVDAINKEEISINLSNLYNRGIFYVRIQTENGIAVKKFYKY